MKECYELKNPRKNPYAERMKNGYTIIIDRDPDEDECKPLDYTALRSNLQDENISLRELSRQAMEKYKA